MKYLELKGTYVCLDCGKTISIEESFSRDDCGLDTVFEAECSCGLGIRLEINFNNGLEHEESEEEDEGICLY